MSDGVDKEVLERYVLIRDKDNCEIAEFLMTEKSKYSISGVCNQFVGWALDGEAFDKIFFASVYSKWDASSSWRFCGEDYEEGDQECDAVYGFGGLRSLMDHARIMGFVWYVLYESFCVEHADSASTLKSIREWFLDDELSCGNINDLLTGYTIMEHRQNSVRKLVEQHWEYAEHAEEIQRIQDELNDPKTRATALEALRGILDEEESFN